jgi:hypothetical protein
MDSINDEWEKFISSSYDDEYSDNIEELKTISDENISFTISDRVDSNNKEIPKATEIYISTKSKIAYLNREIDLKEIFWNIPIVPYAMPKNGVIKKQIKFNSTTQEEVDIIQENLKKELYFEEQVLTSINNPNGRIKFKDIRKISVGISKKDIMSYRSKKKSAFYNCFVMILRIKINDIFKEFHIKVFNTGKMEIPGIQNDMIYETVISTILTTLQPHIKEPLGYLQKSDTVLVNSNFNCGYYISREVLFDILKQKYNIQCIYDPCSYPGIQCKFYYNPNVEVQTGKQISAEDKEKYPNIVEVSFMIFRTGSILIVGMCDDNVLYMIYDFLKKILIDEYYKINQRVAQKDVVDKTKDKKIRKKNILIVTNNAAAVTSSVLA